MKTYEETILFLVKHFKEQFNINQIARFINRRPSGVFRELDKMENRNIVLSKRVGNAKIYELNLKSLETRKLCELILISEKNERLLHNPLASIVSKDLTDLEEYSDIVMLFGSVLKKQETRDIDVLVVTRQKFIKDVERICREVSRIQNKNVLPLILSYSDFVNNIRKMDKVIMEIIRSGVVLSGYEKFVRGMRDGKV